MFDALFHPKSLGKALKKAQKRALRKIRWLTLALVLGTGGCGGTVALDAARQDALGPEALAATNARLQRAVDAHPEDPELQYLLGRGLLRANRPRVALPHAQRALFAYPTYAPYLALLGRVQAALARPIEARQALRQALDGSPPLEQNEFSLASLALAEVHNRLGEPRAASQVLRRGLQRDRYHSLLGLRLARQLLRLGDASGAEGVLKPILRFPSAARAAGWDREQVLSEALLLMARALRLQRRYAEAASKLVRLAARHEDLDSPWRRRTILERARLAYAEQDPATAQRILDALPPPFDLASRLLQIDLTAANGYRALALREVSQLAATFADDVRPVTLWTALLLRHPGASDEAPPPKITPADALDANRTEDRAGAERTPSPALSFLSEESITSSIVPVPAEVPSPVEADLLPEVPPAAREALALLLPWAERGALDAEGRFWFAKALLANRRAADAYAFLNEIAPGGAVEDARTPALRLELLLLLDRAAEALKQAHARYQRREGRQDPQLIALYVRALLRTGNDIQAGEVLLSDGPRLPRAQYEELQRRWRRVQARKAVIREAERALQEGDPQRTVEIVSAGLLRFSDDWQLLDLGARATLSAAQWHAARRFLEAALKQDAPPPWPQVWRANLYVVYRALDLPAAAQRMLNSLAEPARR